MGFPAELKSTLGLCWREVGKPCGGSDDMEHMEHDPDGKIPRSIREADSEADRDVERDGEPFEWHGIPNLK
ncbi:MAG: hypothetical protein ABGW87_02890 [Sphingomonadaceae bacterium]